MWIAFRVIFTLLLWSLAGIGLALLLILWEIHQHPFSVWHWIHILMPGMVL